MEKAERKPGEPYCSNCGYSLVGATESAVCPECGRPLVEVLMRHNPAMRFGGRIVRYSSKSRLFGVPILSVAFGPRPDHGERMGRAKGIIAVGDQAIGGIAIGGMSCGVVAVGGVSVGVASIGGMAIGLATALGGGALGGLAVGGGAVGGIATGGGAMGIVAQGGGAIGFYARGGNVMGVYTIDFNNRDGRAQQVFTTLEPVVGKFGGTGLSSLSQPMMCVAGFDIVLAGIIGLLALLAYGHSAGRKERNSYAQVTARSDPK